MEARYLRVKNWGEFQHYRDKEPGWIKLYARVVRDSRFLEMDEFVQWQLVRVWVAASQASRHCLDQEGRRVPVIPDDELYLRRAISTIKKLPLAMFIREGWLVPVAAEELLDEVLASSRPELVPALDAGYAETSSLASGHASGRSITRDEEKKERDSRAVSAQRDAQPSNLLHIDQLIDKSLAEAAAL